MMRYCRFWLFAVSCAAGNLSVADEKGEISPVKVVFYNLKNYLAMDRRVDGELVLGAPKPEREVKHLIEGLSHIKPDILGVCEIGDADYLKDFQKRLKAVGLDYPHTELLPSKSGFDRNLALLSRFPIKESHSRDDYTYRIYDQKFPFQRGVLDATVQVTKDYELRCILLHLKSKREVSEADQSEMRLNEAQLARSHLDKIFQSKPDANILVMGDLNEFRNEAPIKAVQGFFGGRGYLSAISLSDLHGFRWTHHWSFADSYSRFDYAMVSRGITGEVDRRKSYIHHWENWDDASDHRPLVVSVVPVDKPIRK